MPFIPLLIPELKKNRQCHSDQGKILRLMNTDNVIHIEQTLKLIEDGQCRAYQGNHLS